jgi:hypothetical protein
LSALGNGQNWLADLGYRLQVVVLDLNFEGFGGHGAPRRPGELDAALLLDRRNRDAG